MSLNLRRDGSASWALLILAVMAAPLLAQEDAGKPAGDDVLGWEGMARLQLEGYGISGDDDAFREYHQKNDSFNGGIEDARFSDKRADGLIFWGDAHVDAPNDMGLHLNLKKEGAGWAKLSLDQADYYYDAEFQDTSSYPVNGGTAEPFLLEDNGPLRTNNVNLNMEVGLALEDFPKVWLGYDHRQKWGKRSTWIRSVDEHPGTTGAVEHGIGSNWFEPEHESDRIYAGLSWDVGCDWNVTLLPQYEIVRGSDEYSIAFFDDAVMANRQFRKQVYDYTRAQVDATARGPLVKDKLTLEVGYHYDAAWNENNMESDSIGDAPYAEKSFRYRDNEHESDSYMHRFYMELTWEACESVTAWVGFQYRNGVQDNDSVRKDDGAPDMDTVPRNYSSGSVIDVNGPLEPDQYWFFDTENDEEGWAESIGLELRCIPKTKLIAEGEFEQIDVDYDWTNTMQYDELVGTGAGTSPVRAGFEGDFIWDDTGSYNRYTAKVHANSECTDWMRSNLKYKYVFRDADHDEDVDYAEIKDDDPGYAGLEDAGAAPWIEFFYPGAIEDTERERHDVKWILNFEVTDWLTVAPRAGFTYESNDVENQDNEEIAWTRQWLYGANVQIRPNECWTLTTDAYLVDGLTLTRAGRFTNSFFRNPITGAAATNFYGAVYDPIEFDWDTVSQLIQYQMDQWTFNVTYMYSRQVSWWRGYRHMGSIGALYKISEKHSIDATFGYEDYSEEQNGDVNEYDGFMGILGFKGKF